MAQIKLKKLTGVKVGDDTIDSVSSSTFGTKIGTLTNGKKVDFVGQDYKGTLDNFAASGKGVLELYLERPENYFKIEGVKATGTSHKYDGKKDATIDIVVASPKIISKDSSWFTTEWDLKGFTTTGSSLKFGEWNDFDLADKHYVHIDFV